MCDEEVYPQISQITQIEKAGCGGPSFDLYRGRC